MAAPSSFGMTPTLLKIQKKKKILKIQKKKNFVKKYLKSRCYTKRRAGAAMRGRPSFGMTPTQDIRDLFA